GPSGSRVSSGCVGYMEAPSPEVPVEELVDGPPDFEGIEERPAVPRPPDRLERHLHAALPQRIAEQLALVDRDQRVLIAVHDQERRIVLRDVRDWIRIARLLSVLLACL